MKKGKEQSTEQNTNRNKKKIRLDSHDCIWGTKDFFALWITRANSLANFSLHFRGWGSSLLNNHEFLSDHMLQYIRMIMSIEKGSFSCLLMCLVACSGLSHDGTFIPIRLQQFLAKEHLKKRCLKVTSRCSKHSSQSKESRVMFFLRSMPLVLSLFLSRSQKNTLCFG
jgi:hypothetical protein